MRSRIVPVILILAVPCLSGACASAADWQVWRSHTSHFASGEHGLFSLRNNKDASNPRVARSDMENSRQQTWWGIYAINVDQSQIFQN